MLAGTPTSIWDPRYRERVLDTMSTSCANDSCLVDQSETNAATCNTSWEEGSHRGYDALTIALGQEIAGPWYVSTLELQLASFQLCSACRGVRTLLVTVDKRMPLSLWGDDDSVGYSPKTRECRQLPVLRAAGVRWRMPTAILVSVLSEGALLKDAEWMQVTGVDCESLRPRANTVSRSEDWSQLDSRMTHSPRSYFQAMLPLMEGEDLGIPGMLNTGSVSWPSALRQLSIGCIANNPVDWLALPSSLERLSLGGYFNDSIDSAVWPVSLTQLTLGGWFDAPIDDVVWPSSLLKLTFGEDFNQGLEYVVWPDSLMQLTFGKAFDDPITGVVWPASLAQLTFGDFFNQPITGVVWPASLLRLAFGNSFDKPITDVVWPESLKRLEFGERFNQPIAEVVWPIDLLSLAFGREFDQSVEDVVWPTSLRSLAFSDGFVKQANAIEWPPSLEPLMFRHGFSIQGFESDFPPRKDSFDEPRVKHVQRRLH